LISDFAYRFPNPPKSSRGGDPLVWVGDDSSSPNRRPGLSYFCKNAGAKRTLGFIYYAP